jgi:hypothetical protein
MKWLIMGESKYLACTLIMRKYNAIAVMSDILKYLDLKWSNVPFWNSAGFLLKMLGFYNDEIKRAK